MSRPKQTQSPHLKNSPRHRERSNPMKTAKPTPMPIKGKPPAKPFIDPVKGNRPVGPKMPTKPMPIKGKPPAKPSIRPVGPKMPTKPMPPVKGKPPVVNSTMPVTPKGKPPAANKMFGMAMGGMTGKKGYAKGGMIKANCGASMKPAQKSGKK